MGHSTEFPGAGVGKRDSRTHSELGSKAGNRGTLEAKGKKWGDHRCQALLMGKYIEYWNGPLPFPTGRSGVSSARGLWLKEKKVGRKG